MTGAAAYPLAAVRALRAEEEDARGRELAAAIGAHGVARIALERADAARASHAAETERVIADERERDVRGRAVAETLRAQDWLARRRTEAGALEAQVERARREEREADRAIDAARARLAEARAERQAVEKHHTAWQEQRRKARDQREEDEADDRGQDPRS